MNFEYKFYITIEGKYFYAVDKVTGMVLASTCAKNRVWFTQKQANDFKELLEAAGFQEVEIHNGQQYLDNLKNLFYAGRITERHLISEHYEYREEIRSYVVS